ncbi:MAG: MarR family transcriptional regulator [Pseudomonadota bacterium]
MSDASKARLRLWLRLLKAQRTIEAEIREKLRRDHDTTLPRFDVMAALWRVEKGLKMSELSGQLRVSNGNVTGIVDRLVEDGLIERLPVEGDRRAMRVRLTGEGRASFAEMAEVHEGWIDQMLSGIVIDVAEDMASQLHEITEHIDRRNPS